MFWHALNRIGWQTKRGSGSHRTLERKGYPAEPFRNIDFSTAKRGAVIPAEPGKRKVSIRIDNAVIEHFRAQVERAGSRNYQTLINDALVTFIQQRSVIDPVRQVVREELATPRHPPRRARSRTIAV